MSSVSPNKPRVLVVDDSKLIRMAAEKILASDYDVVFAVDGEEAWKHIQRDAAIRIVFSDLTMPKLDGFALLKQMRNSGEARITSLPLIIMTTDADDENRRETALQLGATDFIAKPFNSIDLKARAKAHITSERITRELKQRAAQLETVAYKDVLTGLGNRSYLLEKLWHECTSALKQHRSLSLVRVDIDGFNLIFVEHGKEVAQQLLQNVARLVASSLPTPDLATRIGLAAFVVLFPGEPHATAMAFAEQIRQQVKNTNQLAGLREAAVTLSGAVLTPVLQEPVNIESYLAELELLVYQAGDAGGDRIHTPVMEATPSLAPASDSSTGRLDGISLEQALQWAQAGQTEALQPHLSELAERLQPLLRLMNR